MSLITDIAPVIGKAQVNVVLKHTVTSASESGMLVPTKPEFQE
jgi:hypothetical protein